MEAKKILVCGGHMTPAIAVIEQINREYPAWKVVYVGRKFALEGDQSVSAEYQIIHAMNIRFVSLFTGRVRRFIDIRTVISILKIPFGFLHAIFIVAKENPDVVLSFGGYIGLPLLFSGWLLGKPTIIHEQTHRPGLSNSVASWFSRTVCVSYEDSVKYFPGKKTTVTGLPVRAAMYAPPSENTLGIPRNSPIIYISGGNTGSYSINHLLYPIISRLSKKYIVIHQVGNAWIKEAKLFRQMMRGDKRKNYFVFPFVDGANHSWILHHAEVYVGRSGANTVSELMIVGKKALFLPLPWSARNEQQENARYYERFFLSVVFNQSEVTSELLFTTIADLVSRKNVGVAVNSDYQHASKSIVQLVAMYVTPVHDSIAEQ